MSLDSLKHECLKQVDNEHVCAGYNPKKEV